MSAGPRTVSARLAPKVSMPRCNKNRLRVFLQVGSECLQATFWHIKLQKNQIGPWRIRLKLSYLYGHMYTINVTGPLSTAPCTVSARLAPKVSLPRCNKNRLRVFLQVGWECLQTTFWHIKLQKKSDWALKNQIETFLPLWAHVHY